MKYTIEINGYGGEVVLGKLTKEQYDYWIDHADRESEELHSHLFWDPWSDEDGNPITDDEDPRWLGQWYEIDSEAHVCNALHDNCRVTVYDEDGNDVMEEDDVEIASTTFHDCEEGYLLHAWSSEKGQVFYAEFETDKFDPKKLKFYGSDVEGELFIDSVEYDGNELDNEGGDTTGKAYGYHMYEA